MKFRFLLVFFLFSSVAGFSQKSEVEEVVKQMFLDMNNRDYDAILDMTYNKVFDLVPKSQMRTIISALFEGNDQVSIDIPKTIPNYQISEIFKNQKNYLEYAFVVYDLKMNMTFHKMEFDSEGQKMMKANMKSQGMIATFKSEKSVDVLMKDRITIILKDHHTNNKWKMLNYDPNSPLFEKMTPAILIEKSKEFKQSLLLKSNN
jgi:hypothetical protein